MAQNKQNKDEKFRTVFQINDTYLKVIDARDNHRLKDFYECSLDDEIRHKRLRDLEHPNLLKIDCYKGPNKLYVVEEPATSMDLIQRCAALYNDNFHEEQIVLWLYQILSAVDYLHSNGIMHKRISKGWISFVGDELKLIVNRECTFVKDEINSAKILTNRSECNFNAPEFVQLGSHLSLKYDLWCVGWLLFNMCSLENPCDILKSVVDFKTWQKPSLPNRFSYELNDIFEKMTNVRSWDRPDANEILKSHIFFDCNLYLRKLHFESRYLSANNDDSGRFSFVVNDGNDNNQLKLLKRYFKTNDKVEKLYLKKFSLLKCSTLNFFEDFFKDMLFSYTIQPIFKVNLNVALEGMKPNSNTNKLLEWFGDILEAVNFLHKNKIIHKYICPNFIGFENDMIKLSIYEKSEVFEDENDLILVNKLECALNSPEICSRKKINFKYDIWCLGWTLYKMLTLEDKYFEFREKENFENFQPPSLQLFDYSPELDNIFTSMVQIKFNSRPSVERIIKQFSNDSSKIFYWSKESKKTTNEEANNDQHQPVPMVLSEKEDVIMDRYVKKNALKSDCFAYTYLVEDLKNNKEKLEMKLYKFTNMTTNDEIKNLVRFSKLSEWPSTILKYYDYFCTNQLYIITEYIETRSLEECLLYEGAANITFNLKLLWLEQLIYALQYLHKIGIIHRDVRPANIKIDANDSIKLGSMGLKYIYTSNENFKNFDESVLRYMSPELINLAKHDSKTDIWSYGCVFYELITGYKAFDGNTKKEIIKKITSEPAPDLEGGNLMVALNRKMMSKSSSLRPEASRIIEALQLFRS